MVCGRRLKTTERDNVMGPGLQRTLQQAVLMGRCRFIPGKPHKVCAGVGEPRERGHCFP